MHKPSILGEINDFLFKKVSSAITYCCYSKHTLNLLLEQYERQPHVPASDQLASAFHYLQPLLASHWVSYSCFWLNTGYL